ncbi:MAG: EAL domain-containing protein, partial [Microcoleus sp. SIO2G3]|nr:EAL domain-containing protein [Microcoleus sp. SIO2G3]
MTTAQPSRVNIYELIERREIEIVFQPIVSIRRGAIVGVEALSRGLSSNGRQIQPIQLFKLAKIAGLTDELDRLCRITAIENFLSLYAANPELILFINVDPAAIDEIATGSDSLLSFLEQKSLNPRNIAIEIIEEEFSNSTQLEEIVSLNKEHGFLTVLDNVGVGHSNL